MSNIKMNFIKQLTYAIAKPNKYYRLTKVSNGRMIGFVFLFTIITSLFSILPMFYIMTGPNGFTQYLKEDLPHFEMKNGEFNISKPYEEHDGNTYILVNSNVEKFSKADIDQSYSEVILVSKTNMILYQSFGETQELNFADLGNIHFDNSIINVLMPFLYIIFFIAAVFIYLFAVAGFFLTALIYSVLGLIVSVLCRANLTFATIFKNAVYGKITAEILSSIISIIPVELPSVVTSGLPILITCSYVVFGIISHTSEEAYKEAGISVPPNNF